MLIRSMSPEVIAVDEIGNYEDINGIEMILNSGCKLLATVHGSSIEDIQKKPLLERMIRSMYLNGISFCRGKIIRERAISQDL